MTSPDPEADRCVRFADRFLSAAKRSRAAETAWADDSPEILWLASHAMAVWQLDVQRSSREPIMIDAGEMGSARVFVCGYHLPGAIGSDGRPELFVLRPDDVGRRLPGDCLPVALIVPKGKEPLLQLSYPDAR